VTVIYRRLVRYYCYLLLNKTNKFRRMTLSILLLATAKRVLIAST